MGAVMEERGGEKERKRSVLLVSVAVMFGVGMG